jgi:ATP/maltotriose-dependent transcriptional regulator MalT/DNA-binding SARP family transcriptional activator
MPTLAKLTRPKVHRAVPRERLFAHIDTSLERPLVWVTAPPGAGKTTLISSYIEARKVRSVWYQVDAGDDDIGTFFYYLAQTVPAARAKSTPALPLLTPEHRVNLPAYSRHFFRVFFSRLSSPTAVVLDNYHELPISAPLHQIMETAAAEAPEGINIVAISRTGPPSELLPLQLNERVAIIDWSLLRLSLDETRAIASQRATLDEAMLQRIHHLADGWAAGLALTLQRVSDKQDQPAREHEARGELFNYFATQILQSVTAETRQFLLRTALLPSMTAAMARHLSGNQDSESLLDDLYRRGMFIDRRHTRPLIYHYHDLFRDFLLTQLEQSLSADAFHELQFQAAALLEQSQQQDQAIRLYLKAKGWQAAKRLILSSAPQLLAQGRGSALNQWLNALPVDMADEDPWIEYWHGAVLARVVPADARNHFIRAFNAFAHRGDVTAQRMACADVIMTFLHEFANLVPMDRWTAAMLRLLDDPLPFPTHAIELQVRTASLFALGFRQPEPTAVAACMSRVLELLDTDVPRELATISAGTLIMHLYLMGDLHACMRLAARMKRMLEDADVSPTSRALGSMQMGHAIMRFGDCGQARQLYEQALQIGDQHALPLPTLYVYSHMGLAFCALDDRDLAQADFHRRKVEEYWVPSRKIDVVASARMQLCLAGHRRQWAVALKLAEHQLQAAYDCGVFMLKFEAHVLLAMVNAELDRTDDFARALNPVKGMLADTGYAHFTYLVDMAQAYFALLKGDMETCREHLRAGFAGSKQDQGMLVFRLHVDSLSRLAAEALTADIEVDHVTHLVRSLNLRAPDGVPRHWPWPLRVHTLGRFEVLNDGQPLEFSRKAPKKTLALLKAIIAFGGQNVREQLLLDAFWSDEEGDVAARSLTAALHRLRGLLGDNEAVIQQGGTLSLNPVRVWVDVWGLEEQLARGNALDSETLLDLYRGSFLVEDEGEPWSVTMRERLRGKFIHALVGQAQQLESAGRFDQAIEGYLRGLDADPVIEQFYQGLMRCYARLDRKSEAIAAYRRLKQMLSISLSLKPSPSTEKLYQSLRLEQVSSR